MVSAVKRKNKGKFMLKYTDLKIIQKEIDIIRDDFRELESAYLLPQERKEKIQRKRDKCIEKLSEKYALINKAIEEIDNEEIKLIIRCRLKGYSYNKIGNLMNYSKVAVFQKFKKWLKVNKINKK